MSVLAWSIHPNLAAAQHLGFRRPQPVLLVDQLVAAAGRQDDDPARAIVDVRGGQLLLMYHAEPGSESAKALQKLRSLDSYSPSTDRLGTN